MLKNKALVGAGVLLGGSVLLYATVNQIMHEKKSIASQVVTESVVLPKQDNNIQENNMIQPLTADIQTEQNILAQKQKEREQRVQQQEKEAQRYLTEQQRIEAEAIARSRAENQLYVKEDEIARPVVTPRPIDTTPVVSAEQVVAPSKTEPESQKSTTEKRLKPQAQLDKQNQLDKQKPEQKTEPQKPTQLQTNQQENTRPSTYQVKRGEGLIQLSRRYDIPVDVLAQANNLDKNTSLSVGQQLNIPTEKQVKRLQQEAQAKEQQKQQFQNADDKLKQTRQMAKKTDAKGSFGVQVALASDQAKADEVVKKLQSAGYKVKTSQTSRGVRVVVGPETGKDSALALKDKINSDPRIEIKNAWVLYW
ncbi:LysM peptidoglycan-binding domain-containing protein [Moraxella macacae]|nr:LysM peptidoglycan-binding domain-containing protein [Moraxella macacae]